MNTKDKIWFAQRQLEIAGWEDILTEPNISKERKQLYKKAIRNCRLSIKNHFKEG